VRKGDCDCNQLIARRLLPQHPDVQDPEQRLAFATSITSSLAGWQVAQPSDKAGAAKKHKIRQPSSLTCGCMPILLNGPPPARPAGHVLYESSNLHALNTSPYSTPPHQAKRYMSSLGDSLPTPSSSSHYSVAVSLSTPNSNAALKTNTRCTEATSRYRTSVPPCSRHV
jgi:hypothetical protein